MDFASNLKKVRLENKLSQQQLADKLRVAQSTVGMWEAGRRTPKLSEMKRLAHVLNVTVTRLIGAGDQQISITKNEIYVDGRKLQGITEDDVLKVIRHIEEIKKSKEKCAGGFDSTDGKDSSHKKILIIDDEQEICELLYSFLVPHNYKVFLTFNGQMGLEYFEEIVPDVILLDLTLPDIEGKDVLKIIRRVSDVPVIVVTAHPQDIADIHLEQLEIEGYIEKPFSLEEVLNTLKHVVGE